MLVTGEFDWKNSSVILILVIAVRVGGDVSERTVCPRQCFCSSGPPVVVSCSETLKGDLKPLATQVTDVEELFVENSDIRYLKNETLSELSTLKKLKMARSRIYGIEEQSLQHFRQLTNLDLSSNRIEVIGKPASLLDKTFNYAIAFIPDFTTSKYLRDVDLSNNNIKFISPAALYGLKFVQHLNLSGNNIFEVTSSYRYLMGVKVLDLSYNRIMTVDENFGSMQMVLKELYLSHNYVKVLGNFSIPACFYLEHVDLSFNEISSVVQAGLRNCVTLQTLNLEGNKLKIIRDDDFASYPELRFLNLAGNLISVIPDHAFASSTKLESFFATGNNIKGISNNTLKGLISLAILNLASNDIKSIAEDAFADNMLIGYIFLQDNDISSIHPNTFMDLTLLKIIDLSKNRLSNPYPEWFLSKNGPYYFDTRMKKVVRKIQGSNATFLLLENNWACDCTARTFLQWSHDQREIEARLLPPIFCASPVFHSKKNLLEMDQSDLSCDASFYLFSFLIFYSQFFFFMTVFTLASCVFYYKRKRFVKEEVHVL